MTLKATLVSAEHVQFEIEQGWITVGETYDVYKYEAPPVGVVRKGGSLYIVDDQGDIISFVLDELNDFEIKEEN